MSVINPDKVSDLIREAAHEFILPRYKALSEGDIASKSSPNDLVTKADIEAEAFLEKTLPDLLPGSILIGEEGVSRGDHKIEILKDPEAKIWVVDPVDGTSNFVQGRKEFGVMVGLVIGGVTEYGWIFDVLEDDMAVTEKGSGAFIQSRRLQVREVDDPIQMHGFLNRRFYPEKYHEHINSTKTAFGSCVSCGCAAHEYLRIAKGDAQFTLYYAMKPWDHIPSSLLLAEAGGQTCLWDRSPYAPADYHCGIIATAGAYTEEVIYNAFVKDKMFDPIMAA